MMKVDEGEEEASVCATMAEQERMAHRALYPISKKSVGSYDNNILSEEENKEWEAGNMVEHGLFLLSEGLTLEDSTIRTHDEENEMVEPKTLGTHHIDTNVINERQDVWYGNSDLEILQPETTVCFQKDNCHLVHEKNHFAETRVRRVSYSVKDENIVLEKDIPAAKNFNSNLSFDIIKGVMQRRIEGDTDVYNYKEGKKIMEEEFPSKNINMNNSPVTSSKFVSNHDQPNLSNIDDIILENIGNKRMMTQKIVAQQEFENGMLQIGTSGSWFHHGLPPPSVDNYSIPQSRDDRNSLNPSYQVLLDESNSQFPDGTPHKEVNKETCKFLQSDQVSYSSSISLRSDSSTKSEHSFTFPILQAEWNSSPVRMPHADQGEHFRQHRIWRIAFPCCKF